MKAHLFADAGWHIDVLSSLRAHGCDAIELSEQIVLSQRSTSIEAVNSLVQKAHVLLGESHCWVISGHEAPQPKTRIAMRRRLWGGLALDIEPTPCEVEDWLLPSSDELRFFGFANRKYVSDEKLLNWFEELPTTWLLIGAVDVVLKMKSELESGWSGVAPPLPIELLEFLCDKKAILIRSFGPTSDHVAGAIAVAPIKLMEALRPSVLT